MTADPQHRAELLALCALLALVVLLWGSVSSCLSTAPDVTAPGSLTCAVLSGERRMCVTLECSTGQGSLAALCPDSAPLCTQISCLEVEP